MLYRAMLKARNLLDHSPSDCGGSVEWLLHTLLFFVADYAF
jgi:hypothetical protein